MFGDQKRSSKKDLRVRVRSILSQIEERELVRKSELVSSNLHRLFSGDSTLDKVIPPKEESFFFGGFAPLKDEPNWLICLEEVLKGLMAFPGCDRSGNMLFYKADTDDLVLTNSFGAPVLTPPPGNLVVHPKLIIVPGLAFGENGSRLGRGKGFYDKYLENFSGLKIGVCFSEQVFEGLPMESNDVFVDYVVTDEKIYIPGES
ncbi:MAG: 5-formyltetrahydrofolate cyclo-ligase [Halobacteriovoraceae bacterium]|nr:5-formyltetrahydrofolate cyclo-ligase [Halobacteriovoraceae bacterium]